MSQKQRCFSDFVRRIHAWQTPEALRETIANGILELISGENSIVVEFDTRQHTLCSALAQHPFNSRYFFETINSFLHEHPLNKFIKDPQHSGVTLLSHHASRQQWHDTSLYNEALREDGIEDQIAVEIGRPGQQLLGVGVMRSSRGFSDQDKQILALLTPHFEQATRNMNHLECMGVAKRMHHRAEPELTRGLILLNEYGHATHLSSGASRLLDCYYGRDTKRCLRLPEELTKWIQEQIRNLSSGTEAASSSFRKLAASGTLDLRLFRDPEDSHFLLIASERQTKPGSVQFASLGLTRREVEVLGWVSQGKTNSEIAIILGVSFYTIKAQMKSIFRRLGVETRTAAAAMAIEIASRSSNFFH